MFTNPINKNYQDSIRRDLTNLADDRVKELLALPEVTLLGQDVAAAILNVKPSTLAVWRSTGRHGLKYVKMGRRVRYQLSEIYKFMERNSRTYVECGGI